MLRGLLQGLLLALCGLLGGCSTLSYYGHLARGQLELLQARKPIQRWLDDPATPAALKTSLTRAAHARGWATTALGLPDNGSYTAYVDLGREQLLWNLFATPELSLEARHWCYPLVGCLAYRGYYRRDLLDGDAQRLRQEGLDVHIGAVPAYSSLGWFDDPLLNTMMHGGDPALIGTLFHELAHQRLFVDGDTAFNESYAAFVEDEGLRQYRAAGYLPADPGQRRAGYRRDFIRLMLDTREQLDHLYRQPLSDPAKRAGKAQVFAELRSRYAALRDGLWQGYRGYDVWFAAELNNAMLLPFGLYDEFKPAFATLYADSGGSWARFHQEAKALGRLPAARRAEALTALASRAEAQRVADRTGGSTEAAGVATRSSSSAALGAP